MAEPGLTWRQYRWLWAWWAFLVVAAPLVYVLAAAYMAGRVLVRTVDAAEDATARLHAWCHNRDMARVHGRARRPGAARPDGWLP